jgi:hypothetical protein
MSAFADGCGSLCAWLWGGAVAAFGADARSLAGGHLRSDRPNAMLGGYTGENVAAKVETPVPAAFWVPWA